MSEDEHAEFIDRELNRTIERAHQRGAGVGVGAVVDQVDPHTPLSALIAAEEGESGGDGDERAAVILRFLDFCLQDGEHPAAVMRNFYAVVSFVRPELLHNMGVRDIGKLLGRTGAAHSWRVKKLFEEKIKAAGGHATKAPWQRSDSGCASYAAAQRANQNRRKKPKQKRAA